MMKSWASEIRESVAKATPAAAAGHVVRYVLHYIVLGGRERRGGSPAPVPAPAVQQPMWSQTAEQEADTAQRAREGRGGSATDARTACHGRTSSGQPGSCR